MVILSMAGQCEASRSTRGAAFVRELIPGGRAWQSVLALSESSRLGRQAAGGPAPQAGAGHCLGRRLDLFWPEAAMRRMNLTATECEQLVAP
jgi:hypothetical protein